MSSFVVFIVVVGILFHPFHATHFSDPSKGAQKICFDNMTVLTTHLLSVKTVFSPFFCTILSVQKAGAHNYKTLKNSEKRTTRQVKPQAHLPLQKAMIHRPFSLGRLNQLLIRSSSFFAIFSAIFSIVPYHLAYRKSHRLTCDRPGERKNRPQSARGQRLYEPLVKGVVR